MQRPLWESALVVLLSIAASVAVVLTVNGRWPALPTSQPKLATVVKNDRVVALGTIIPAGGVVQLSATPGDRIHKILVSEGMTVQAEQVVVELDSLPLRQAEEQVAGLLLSAARKQRPLELEAAELLCSEAECALAIAKLRDRDIETQEQRLPLLEAAATQAAAELKRLTGLESDVVAVQTVEKQRLLADQAASDLRAAKQALDKLRSACKNEQRLAESKRDEAQVAKRRLELTSSIDALEKQLEIATAKVRLSQIRAPHEGTVLQLLMHEGETTGAMPIMRLARIDKMYVEAEVYETDRVLVEEGQKAEIKASAWYDPKTRKPRVLVGRVAQIGRLVARNQVHSLDPLDRANARVVPVRIDIAPGDRAMAADWIHLQVRAEILLDEKIPDWSTTPAATAATQSP